MTAPIPPLKPQSLDPDTPGFVWPTAASAPQSTDPDKPGFVWPSSASDATRNVNPRPGPALGYASPTYDIGTGVPADVHFAVSGQATSPGKLRVLQSFYPDAFMTPTGDMAYTNPATGKLTTYTAHTNTGALKQLIDAAPGAVGLAGMIGGGVAGGAAAAETGPGAIAAARIAGAGVGATLQEGYQALVRRLTNTAALDPSTPADVRRRLMGDALNGAGTEGIGLGVGKFVAAAPAMMARVADAGAVGVPLTFGQTVGSPSLDNFLRSPLGRLNPSATLGGAQAIDAAAQRAVRAAGTRILGAPVRNLDVNAAATDAADSWDTALGAARNVPWTARDAAVTAAMPRGVTIPSLRAWVKQATALAEANAIQAPRLQPAIDMANRAIETASARGGSVPFSDLTTLRTEAGDMGWDASPGLTAAQRQTQQAFRGLQGAIHSDVLDAVNTADAASGTTTAADANTALNEAVKGQKLTNAQATASKISGAPSDATSGGMVPTMVRKEQIAQLQSARAAIPSAQYDLLAQKDFQSLGLGPDGVFNPGRFLQQVSQQSFTDPAMQAVRFGGTSVEPMLDQVNQLARTMRTIGMGTKGAALAGNGAYAPLALGAVAAQLGHPTIGAILEAATFAPPVFSAILNNRATLALLNATIRVARTGVAQDMAPMLGRWGAYAKLHPELSGPINAFLSHIGSGGSPPPAQP